MQEMAIRRQETDAYIRDVAASTTPTTAADQIAEAQKMLDEGVISRPAYDRLKAKALDGKDAVARPESRCHGACPSRSPASLPSRSSWDESTEHVLALLHDAVAGLGHRIPGPEELAERLRDDDPGLV
jgi:hypothetical protein